MQVYLKVNLTEFNGTHFQENMIRIATQVKYVIVLGYSYVDLNINFE